MDKEKAEAEAKRLLEQEFSKEFLQSRFKNYSNETKEFLQAFTKNYSYENRFWMKGES